MDSEQNALRWSAVGSLVLGLLGIGFSWITHSGAIMLDGFFSLVGFGLGLVALKVSALVKQPDDEKFQFGYAALEPTMNAFKGAVTVVLCGFALASAVGALLSGGRPLEAGAAVVYAGFATLACFVIAFIQRRAARRTGSPLVEVDAKTWMLDGVLSVVVGLAFVGAILVEGTEWAFLVPYIDPGLVVLLVLAVISVPVRIFVDSLGELLMVAPDDAVQTRVRGRIAEVLSAPELSRNVVRMVKVGRSFYTMVHVVVRPDYAVRSVVDLDDIRTSVATAVGEIQPEMVVDTIFTTQPKWANTDVVSD